MVLAACSSNPIAASSNGASSSTTAISTTTTAPPSTTTTGTAAPASTTTTAPASTTTTSSSTFLPATGGVFESPSGNISCEVDNGRGGLYGVHCLTISPPQSASLSSDGTYTSCSGMQCLANFPVGSPTLPYGAVATAGPYRCLSLETGVTCTVSGKGFAISKAGVTPYPAPSSSG
ncbi:MAG: hypothetical protein ACYCU7_14950 [Acidimicrobiales bacterium]